MPCLNDGRFIPDVEPQNFPWLMYRARGFLREQNQEVHDGSAFLGRVSLLDSMHFAPACTEDVARMCAQPFFGHIILRHGLQLASETVDVDLGV